MFPDECVSRSNGQHGIVWAQYKPNCHQYVMCQPLAPGKYRKFVMPCGALFWDKGNRTCTRTKTGDCFEGPPVSYNGLPPVKGKAVSVPCNCSFKMFFHLALLRSGSFRSNRFNYHVQCEQSVSMNPN